MPLALDVSLIHGHMVVPTGGCLDLLLIDGHMVVPTGELMDQSMAMDFKSSSHRMVIQWWWYGFGDDGSAKLSSVNCQWKLVKLELSPLIRWTFRSSADTWGPRSLFSPGVASSLNLDALHHHWMLNCLPSDVDFLPSDCDTFYHFSFFYCAVQSLILWSFCISSW